MYKILTAIDKGVQVFITVSEEELIQKIMSIDRDRLLKYAIQYHQAAQIQL